MYSHMLCLLRRWEVVVLSITESMYKVLYRYKNHILKSKIDQDGQNVVPGWVGDFPDRTLFFLNANFCFFNLLVRLTF